LLVATGELASEETASKRTADTGVLILEFALNKPSSERAIKAIARMNYLHDRYRKAGKISNSDMLYTLGVFALEPVRWVNKYEWRKFTDMELCASGTYWKAMGDAMEVSWNELPSHERGWRDGLHWLEEIKEWSDKYEETHMIPAKSNHQLADAHLDVLFINIPARFKLMGKKIVSVFLGERLSKAMMLPQPSPKYSVLINGTLGVRKICLRYLALPRPEWMRRDYIAKEADPVSGRYNSKQYLSHPWYVKPTFKRRWGLRAWTTRLLGRKLPGDDGNKYCPEGYRITEVGPATQKGKGLEAMQEIERQLSQKRRGGCPFGLAAKDG